MVKDDRKYLLHILECVARIEEDVRDGSGAFDASHTIQDAVIRNLDYGLESNRIAQHYKHSSEERSSLHRWLGVNGAATPFKNRALM